MDAGLLISAVCGAISVFLILGLIFNTKFRRDVLGGQGEAALFGVITAKGAAIIVLCALFIGGMLYPLSTSNLECRGAIDSLKAQLAEKLASRVQDADRSSDIDALRGIISRLMESAEKINKSCR
ncbi:hypothetical protein [Pseudomonas auratipiscis]|uniref:Uncharacterized protein n=1 Tax=Pseudomonas auratipiscis TaxID=3115853 RepID=A0AB35WZF3_9PSED|nr:MULTISPECIES: hypothetical protein [unclassified Pseudomonas]MEE1868476.1 hypothetical protein [Pseudomonas sp. 120P]MEE1960849.1 hypothetical protein [Pseudomonas sp. 119P]